MLSSELRKEINTKLNEGLSHQQVFNELINKVDDRYELARNIMLMPSKENFEKAKPLQSLVFLLLAIYIAFGFYTVNFFDAPVINDQNYWLKVIVYAVAMTAAVLFFMYRNQRIKVITIIIPLFYMNFLIEVIAPQFKLFVIADVVLLIALTFAQAIYMHMLVKGNSIESDWGINEQGEEE